MANSIEATQSVLRPLSGTAGVPTTVSHQSNGQQQGQIDPWIVWVTFRRCWPWAIPVGAILSCLAAYYVFYSFVPRYQATHLLEANQDYIVFKNVMPTLTDIARSEKPLIFNPIVIDPVLSDPAITKAPSLSDPLQAERNIRTNLGVASGGTSKLLTVSYRDTDPEAAAMVCNAIVDSYLRQRDAFDNSRVSKLERWLEPEIQRWEQEVEERQHKVQKLSERTLGHAPGERVAVMEDQNSLSLLQKLRSKIADLNVELAVFDAHRTIRDTRARNISKEKVDQPKPRVNVKRIEPTQVEINEIVNKDTLFQENHALLRRFKMQLLELEEKGLVKIVPDHYAEVEKRRDKAMADIETAKAAATKRAVAYLNKKADEDLERRKVAAQQKIIDMDRQYKANKELSAARERQERESLVTKIEVLKNEYAEEKALAEKFGGDSAELQFAQDERKIAMDVLMRLRDRVAAIRTERRQDGTVRSLAPATIPSRPVEVLPISKMIKFAGAAFCIPFMFGLLWELKVKRVADSSAMEKDLTLAPVVGEVARLPAGTRSGKGRRMFEESVDSLRANLFLSVDTKSTRSIAVASSMSGEGKSCVASQLALSIAKATGETVLLVDADLRCPDQHEIFGLEMGPGLVGVLSGAATMQDAVNSSFGDLIHILPAGKLSRSPHRLVSPSAMKDFVDHALQSYGYVVFDTAPVLSAGETLAIASAVDSTLVCVMRDVSRMDNVNRTTRRLEAAGATVAGTVFSGVTARTYAYRYGDYRYAVAGEVQA